MVVAICLWLVLGLAISAPIAENEFKTGEPVESVACRETPDHRYALYLPSSYTTAKKWPILFCFDPAYRGMLPINLYQEAAERLGFILVSTYNYRSDQPTNEAGLNAVGAVWNDAILRYSIDFSRVYSTGFSGGSRLSWMFQYATRQVPFAGIIGVGAGFPQPVSDKWGGPGLAYYGIVGNTDFNYYEMMQMGKVLDKKKIVHRIVAFDGAHEWPKAEECSRALDWMHLQAMKAGLAERDKEYIQGLFERGSQEALSVQSEGDLLTAYRRLEGLIADFDGLLDVSETRQVVAELKASKNLKNRQKTWHREARQAENYVNRALEIMEQIRVSARGSLPPLREALFNLRVKSLQKRAQSEDVEVSLAAQRVMESIFVQFVFYMPRDFNQAGDHERAKLSLDIATAIKPENSIAWFRLARTEARIRLYDSSVAHLRKSLELGFPRPDVIQEDPYLEPLRKRNDFIQLIEEFELRK
jgi:poly(3-hydroxybutyrate) depolymerase